MHLVGVKGEVLAQHGQGQGLAHLRQAGVAALEETLVGQHGKAGGAGCRQAARQGQGVEVGANHALAGGGFLHFGDDGRALLAGAGGQRGGKAPGRRLRGGSVLEGGQRTLCLPCGQFLPLVRDNVVKDGAGHPALSRPGT